MEDHEFHFHNRHHISIIFTYMLTISLFLLTTLPQFHCQPPQPQRDYSICNNVSYNCGRLQNISYPFWGQKRPSYCGGGNLFELHCQEDAQNSTILIPSENISFTVLDINPNDYTMRLKRTDLDHDVCSPKFNNSYLLSDLSPTLFQYPSSVDYNITIFYNCSEDNNIPPDHMCGPDRKAICYAGAADTLLEKHPWLKECRRHIQVPADHHPLEHNPDGVVNRGNLEQVLREGFEVRYTVNEECVRCLGVGVGVGGSEGERCWSCCQQESTAAYCHNKGKLNFIWRRKLVIGAVSALAVLFMCIVICYFSCKKSKRRINFRFVAKNEQVIEAFLKDHGALSQKRYKFSEVKKMTNSFKTKLGQGGFGVVYKGKLHNSSPVAVKILKTSKGNGEEFINEVASISRTSHVNVVTLLGFCFEGHKKALIYEFMPNGSLDKFIYNKGPQNIASLSWEKLYQIAKGIARGLEYLHKGCNTRILHFDIKPHNILLDENFCPKISDFGLAKLCPSKESIISMSVLRGTMGYIAPEVWNRQFGGVSHKSDVYSYGMMLLEMVGVRKNIHSEGNQTSEYFPDWIYNKLELGCDLRPDEVTDTEENEIARGITIVGLWCIQIFPNDRPAMSRVIEMLEGNMNSLEIPPKPMLSSPVRSVLESSTS